jgi:asparagine synthase (glutamine-hydrolysing)
MGVSDESGHPIVLGNRRLAIQDLSAAGHQPMESPDGRYVVTFNGEIYNVDELRRTLGLEPGELRSHSDTEILLRTWARFGADSLTQMVGQWAFALYDRVNRCLWLARDRFGEKPLFYHLDDDRLSFASSIAALLALPWVSREIDEESLAELVSMRYVVSPHTILRGIHKLPPGHLMRVTSEGVTAHRWYELPHWDRDRPPESNHELVDRFDGLFRQAVQRCQVGDVPVAIFQSDGIDSNSIRAAQERSQTTLPCFTFVAQEDRGTSLDASNGPSFGQPVVISMEDRLADLEPALQSLTEPVGDGVAIATWQLVRRCRSEATVFLCGHGGDEIMGGYRMDQDLFRLRLVHRASRMRLPVPASTIERYVNGYEPTSLKRSRLASANARHAPHAARYSIHRPLPNADLQMIFEGGAERNRWWSTIDRLYGECVDEACDLDRMQSVMLRTFLAENLLSFSDAAGMASSAELRLPFLDRDLVQFVLSLPPAKRVRPLPGRQNNKALLRAWARGRVDSSIVQRPKAGFSSGSIQALLREPRVRVVERLLSEDEFTAIMPGLERWLRQPVARFGGAREGTAWALLALAVWYDGLKSDQPAAYRVPSLRRSNAA